MPEAEIVSVQGIQNLLQYQKYYLEKLQLAFLHELENPDDLPNEGEIFDYGKMCNTSLRQAPLKISHREIGSTTELLNKAL